MKKFRAKNAVLAAVFACGTMGTIELPTEGNLSYRLIHSGVAISTSTAVTNGAIGPVRRAPCALIRYYVAKYTAAAAEEWARSKGATEAEIQTARRCIKFQPIVLFG